VVTLGGSCGIAVTELRPPTDWQTKLLRQIVQRTAQIFGKQCGVRAAINFI